MMHGQKNIKFCNYKY